LTEKANLDLAVNGIVFASFIASGQVGGSLMDSVLQFLTLSQTCVAATRILVEKSIMPRLIEKLKIKAKTITRRMGSPQNPESMMGPVISAKQLEGIERLVNDATSCGVDVVTGGDRMSGLSSLDGADFSKGYYYPPTILISTQDASILDTKIWKEEAFGPVIVVVTFESEDEAITLANDSEFGLGAAVWTQDLSQAFRVSDQIEAGICWGERHPDKSLFCS
jgi:acyl-CoA reductase-like NAD-dependent aldehyde dehydrogenase